MELVPDFVSTPRITYIKRNISRDWRLKSSNILTYERMKQRELSRWVWVLISDVDIESLAKWNFVLHYRYSDHATYSTPSEVKAIKRDTWKSVKNSKAILLNYKTTNSRNRIIIRPKWPSLNPLQNVLFRFPILLLNTLYATYLRQYTLEYVSAYSRSTLQKIRQV